MLFSQAISKLKMLDCLIVGHRLRTLPHTGEKEKFF